ncbi:MAG: FMN-binding protein, partial [Planctomycetes bacterium]|nr:FMN-binding protein [Planctomycetota bacterium]
FTLTSLSRPAFANDLVEFLSGSKVTGKVLTIRKDAREFDFEASVGGRTITRTYSYDKVEAVTIDGKRYVLNTKATPASGISSGNSDASTSDPSGQTASDSDGSSSQLSRAEIEQLIENTGSTPPDWYDDVQLQYPDTLDLSWPLKPPGKEWQASKYVFHYLWSNVYPNPGRWQSGAKLIHHILTLHRDDRTLLARDMCELGHMYFRLFQDYPRAAFWYRKGGVEKGTPPSVHLAECYWRLGSKAMALEELQARTVPLDAVKLYSDMGETDRALRLVEAFVRIGRTHEAFLLGGDACRAAGRTEEAVQYYERVLQDKVARNAEYLHRFHARARESIEAIRLAALADPGQVPDGTYSATTTGYAGALEVQVRVAGGRIDSVQVPKHKEKQFYSALVDIPRQIVSKQSIDGIDAVSGATVTSQAIVNGTAKALASAAR